MTLETKLAIAEQLLTASDGNLAGDAQRIYAAATELQRLALENGAQGMQQTDARRLMDNQFGDPMKALDRIKIRPTAEDSLERAPR